jgi:hypothetical protein
MVIALHLLPNSKSGLLFLRELEGNDEGHDYPIEEDGAGSGRRNDGGDASGRDGSGAGYG